MSGLVERLLKQSNAMMFSDALEPTTMREAAARITALEAENERMKLDVEKHEALHVSAYYAGMKAGWDFGMDSDFEGYNRAVGSTEYIAELRRIRAARQALGGPHDAD